MSCFTLFTIASYIAIPLLCAVVVGYFSYITMSDSTSNTHKAEQSTYEPTTAVYDVLLECDEKKPKKAGAVY